MGNKLQKVRRSLLQMRARAGGFRPEAKKVVVTVIVRAERQKRFENICNPVFIWQWENKLCPTCKEPPEVLGGFRAQAVCGIAQPGERAWTHPADRKHPPCCGNRDLDF
jgi:hypothetical protein